MKPFNLEEYLANPERRVVTKAGNKVEIINTNGRKQFPIIGYVDDSEVPASWHSDGRFRKDCERIDPFDLFFADEESEDEVIRREIQAYFNDKKDYRSKWFNWVSRATTQEPAKWSEEAEKDIQEASKCLRDYANKCVQGENSKLYIQSLADRIKSLRPQPKAELTLLDKNIINAAVAFVEQNEHFNYWGGIDKHTVIKALRSLKPHWKPSAKQINKLFSIIAELRKNGRDDIADFLASLYGQLGKLI